MKKLTNVFVIFIIGTSISACSSSASKMTPKKLGWKIGVQAWTFREFTFFQAVNKTNQLGLHYIEAWPGQNVGGDIKGTMKWNNLNRAARRKIKRYLKKKDVKMISYGVVEPQTKAQWDSLFAFAHQMGIKNITTNVLPIAPQQEQPGRLVQLADKYHINVAIHDEPIPTHFWSPDTVLTAIQSQHSRFVGACADVGNWVRSGVHPVKALKKLEGHIIELHMKNEKTWGKPNEDIVWGKGVENIPEIVNLLYYQHFKGFIAIEDKSKPNISEIKKSLQYFKQVVTNIK
jgi:sugar phosphate isomerase/epimerase